MIALAEVIDLLKGQNPIFGIKLGTDDKFIVFGPLSPSIDQYSRFLCFTHCDASIKGELPLVSAFLGTCFFMLREARTVTAFYIKYLLSCGVGSSATLNNSTRSLH